MSLLSLPRDILAIVIDHLAHLPLAAVRQTCRTLHRLCWSSATVSLRSSAAPSVMEHLARFDLLTAVRALALNLSADPHQPLATLGNLTSLRLLTRVPSDCIRSLRELPALTRLRALHVPALDVPSLAVAVDILTQLTQLHTLRLPPLGPHLEAAVARRLTQLTTLDLTGWTAPEELMRSFGPALTKLRFFTYLQKWNPRMIEALPHITSLELLFRVPSIDAAIFSRLTALKELVLRLSQPVTPEQPLCLPAPLQRLTLSHLTLEAPLANVPAALHTVLLSNLRLSTEVFAQLSRVRIVTLALISVNADDLYRNIATLSHLTSLRLDEATTQAHPCSTLTQLAPLAPTLRRLNLAVDTSVFATHIGALTNLVYLSATVVSPRHTLWEGPNEALVDCFPCLPKLRFLMLQALTSPAYRPSMATLAALTALQNLTLFIVRPPDAVLLTGLRDLRSLWLQWRDPDPLLSNATTLLQALRTLPSLGSVTYHAAGAEVSRLFPGGSMWPAATFADAQTVWP